jgi:hypothetical protein
MCVTFPVTIPPPQCRDVPARLFALRQVLALPRFRGYRTSRRGFPVLHDSLGAHTIQSPQNSVFHERTVFCGTQALASTPQWLRTGADLRVLSRYRWEQYNVSDLLSHLRVLPKKTAVLLPEQFCKQIRYMCVTFPVTLIYGYIANREIRNRGRIYIF